MEEALRARLLATAGVTALVSQRVHCGSRPQASVLPAITINRVSGAPIYTDDGECGLADARVQIDCWGETYSSAKQTARAVIESLSAFFGTVGAVTFDFVLLDLERDTREGGSNAEEYEFRTQIDFTVLYRN